MIIKKWAALLLLSGVVSLPVHAEFVHTDWKISGDRAATLDTESGLEWLKFSYTDNRSINDVKTEMSNSLAGWRFAALSEVAEVMNRILGTSFVSGVSGSASGSSGKGAMFADLFGITKDYSTDAFSRGLLYNPVSENASFAGVWFNKNPTYQNYNVNYLSSTYALTYRHDNNGVFLVSDGGTTLSSIEQPQLNMNNPDAPINADVPAPAGMVALGLLVLFGLKRRR